MFHFVEKELREEKCIRLSYVDQIAYIMFVMAKLRYLTFLNSKN